MLNALRFKKEKKGGGEGERPYENDFFFHQVENNP